MKLYVQVRVNRGEDLLIFKTVAPCRTVTLGPSPSDTIPTIALGRSVPLLVAGREGYGVRLCPPLSGQIVADGRHLRIHEGLLQDPRPEPLLLRGGDSGRILLDADLTVEFQIHRTPARSRFAPRPALDRGLCISLGVAALVAAVGLLLMAPWRDRNEPPRGAKAVRLRTRPAILSLAKLRPRIPAVRPAPNPPKSGPAALGRRARRPVARLPRRGKARGPGARSLKLLKKSKRIAALLKQGQGIGEILTSVALATPAPTRGASAGLSELLNGSEIGVGRPRARPMLRLLPSSLGRRAGHPQNSSMEAKARSNNPSREAIRKVVILHQRTIRLCYERELISSAKPIEGRLLMRWQIDHDGRPIRVHVENDTVGSQPLRRCIIARIQSWRFPPCATPCTVVYPFDFFPRMS